LKKHHNTRLKETASALAGGEKTAFEVAASLTWDVNCPSWYLFPLSQKWFAFGETLAHLEYLEEKKIARRKTRRGRIVFSLA
jgi:hypothetical protein